MGLLFQKRESYEIKRIEHNRPSDRFLYYYRDANLDRLHLSGILHDIGKIGIPDHVLLKEGKLTEKEFALIKSHPEMGVTILKDSEALSEIIPGINFHHERYDGKGYPDGLKGDEIPLCVQCIAIADTYDAMTSSRPYRKGLSVDFTLEEIKKCGGRQWSTEVVAAFFTAYTTRGIGEKSSQKIEM